MREVLAGVDSFRVLDDYKLQIDLSWALAGERFAMEEQLSLEFLRVVENGAVAAARTMGFGDRHKADEVAVEAMRKTMDAVQMDGTIVIGEGERDEAPMLYIGEKVGLATHAPKALFPEVDIAVDPLEGTNLCATGAPIRSRCWRRASAAGCCTRRICTWKKLLWGRRARARSIWMRRLRII